MISRAWRVAWRASSASRRASIAAPSGSRSIRRESASAAKPMPETVLASESCMSRASRARSSSAASRALLRGELGSASAWRSSSRRVAGAGGRRDEEQRRLADELLERVGDAAPASRSMTQK